jgi:hypothetical protein
MSFLELITQLLRIKIKRKSSGKNKSLNERNSPKYFATLDLQRYQDANNDNRSEARKTEDSFLSDSRSCFYHTGIYMKIELFVNSLRLANYLTATETTERLKWMAIVS